MRGNFAPLLLGRLMLLPDAQIRRGTSADHTFQLAEKRYSLKGKGTHLNESSFGVYDKWLLLAEEMTLLVGCIHY